MPICTPAEAQLAGHHGRFQWDVRLGGPNGERPRRLVGDDGVTSKLQWSRDGTTIYVHRIPPGGTVFGIWAVDPDGRNPRPLTAGQPGVNEYPAT